MQTRERDPQTVYVAVYDTWADWEVGHAIAHINKPVWQRRPGRYQVRTAGASLRPVTTSGGVRITPDVVLAGDSVPDDAALAGDLVPDDAALAGDLVPDDAALAGGSVPDDAALAGGSVPDDAALLILAGADLWDTGSELAGFARLARAFLAAGVPVAAICGATAGLAREGLLDDRDHTSGAAEYLAATGYHGGSHYREAAAVTDGDLITAGPTEPVAFAREIFARLDLYEPHVLEAWFRLFGHSDASAFPVLMAAGHE